MKISRTVSVEQACVFDRWAIGKCGIPSVVLMENAGRAVAEEVLRSIKGKPRAQVSVVCGAGNNGGDGFVAARHLLNKGVAVTVFFIGSPDNLKQDAAVNYKILRKFNCHLRQIRRVDKVFSTALKRFSVIVDAVFGVGLNRPVNEPFQSVIEAINAGGAKIVAVDIPSGLDGDTGEIMGACVKADVTVTFSCAKKGMFLGQGPKHCGKIVVADIGIPLCTYFPWISIEETSTYPNFI